MVDTARTIDAAADDRPARHSPVDLPHPVELPDADVVIFDGKCVFCTRQVRNLKWFDGDAQRLSFVSLHDPWVAEHVPDLTHDAMMKQMYVVARDGATFGGAAAVRYLSRRLPTLWWAAPLLHIPLTLPIWQWGYDLVARRRYKIANRDGEACDPDGTCQIHFDK
mgnify:CR=1 FL=1